MTPQEVALSAQLTRNQQRLKHEEDRLRDSIKTTADALRGIRDSGCWRVRGDPYSSFADYCRKKLGMSEARASQIISAGGTFLALADAAKGEPETLKKIEAMSEVSLRTLKDVTPKKAVSIIKRVAAAGKVTAKAIAKAIGKPDPKPEVCTCPHCGKPLTTPRCVIPD